MALKYVDNFEFWTTTPGTFTSTSGASISGGVLSNSANGGFALISNNLTLQATYIINVRMNLGSPVSPAGGINAVFNLHDTPGSAQQCGLAVAAATNKLEFFRGSAFSGSPVILGATSPLALVTDASLTFYDIESKIVIDNSSGTIECRVNGGVQIGPTGSLDTQGTSNAQADACYIGANPSGGSGGPFRFQHAIVMDSTGSAGNSFIGPVDVILLPPTGDGTYTEWGVTGGPGARWQAVDEVSDPNGDTDYISSGTVGQRNTFTHGSLAGSYTAVKAAAVWINAKRDDATTRAFKVLLRNATPTDNLGAVEHFVGSNYTYFFQPYEVNPFTAAAWTTTEINAVQYGVQVTT